MKKLVIGLSALALVLSIGTASVFAAGNGTARGGYAAGFIDADGDGVCDNRAGGGCGFVDADGDGVCDNRAGGYGTGAQGRRGRGR